MTPKTLKILEKCIGGAEKAEEPTERLVDYEYD